MQKLKYMDRIAKKFADVEPLKPMGYADITVEEMEDTVEQFYERNAAEARDPGELLLDADLQDIFNVSPRRRKDVRPASEFLREHRKTITDKVTYWTGVRRPLIRTLLEGIEKRLALLQLKADIHCEREYLTELTVYCTAMAMNYLTRGKFVHS